MDLKMRSAARRRVRLRTIVGRLVDRRTASARVQVTADGLLFDARVSPDPTGDSAACLEGAAKRQTRPNAVFRAGPER